MVVKLAYDQLARLSIFVNVARHSQWRSHDIHHRHFQRLFLQLEADTSGGIYTLMCALSDAFRRFVHYRCNFPLLGRYRVQAIREVRVNGTRNAAERHIRDFAVARTLMEVSQQLVHDCQQMATRFRPHNRRFYGESGRFP